MPMDLVKIPYDPLVRAVARGLRDRCGVKAGSKLLAAVSGGADSVAMLRALAALAERRTWRLSIVVAHVQHHLRIDGSAEKDAAFVQSLAMRLKLPFVRADLDPSRARRGANIEHWARQARYAALIELAESCRMDFIVTAHHADDQLETLLMRLLRGSSMRGLRGIAWRRKISGLRTRACRHAATSSVADRGESRGPAEHIPSREIVLIRPMLAVDKPTILRFLGDLGEVFQEDHTNRDTTRWRAALRASVVPQLRVLRADVADRAVRLADHFRLVGQMMNKAVLDADAAMSSRAPGDAPDDRAGHDVDPGLIRRASHDDNFSRSLARSLPRVVLAGVLRLRLLRAGVPSDQLGEQTIGPILRAIRDNCGRMRKFNLARHRQIVIDRQTVGIHVARPRRNSDRD